MEFLRKGSWEYTTVCSVGKYALIIYFFCEETGEASVGCQKTNEI